MQDTSIDSATVLSLDYARNVLILGSQEPDRFVTTKFGTIVMSVFDDHEESDNEIGEFEYSLVDVTSGFGQAPLRDIFDASDFSLSDVFDVLYARDGEELSAPVEELLLELTRTSYLENPNILYIDHLELFEEYRGKGFGLRALDGILRAESVSFGLAVLKAYPLQYDEELLKECPKEFRRDTRKLMKHYERLGFRAIPRTPYMLLPHATLWSGEGLYN